MDTPDNASAQAAVQPGDPASAVGFDWSDQLVLGNPKIDGIHREFVEMMQALHRADDTRMLAAVEAALEHTQAHFRHETTLMQLHEFPPIHCHDSEHASVLEVMIAVRDRVAAGEVQYGRVLAAAMMEWLHVHVPTMDAVLVAWLKERGIDESESPPAEGVPATPRALAG